MIFFVGQSFFLKKNKFFKFYIVIKFKKKYTSQTKTKNQVKLYKKKVNVNKLFTNK